MNPPTDHEIIMTAPPLELLRHILEAPNNGDHDTAAATMVTNGETGTVTDDILAAETLPADDGRQINREAYDEEGAEETKDSLIMEDEER
jgi:hypothetical protein